jgi:hypothetical protein
MLYPEKVRVALEAKKDKFTSAQIELQQDIDRLKEALNNLSSLKRDEIEKRLAGILAPGARPTEEQDNYPDIIVPFVNSWKNKQESLFWAKKTLQGINTFAADGSQISPSKDLSIPVGVIQVGWYENRHQPNGEYVKDINLEVLSPDELSEDEGEEGGFPEWIINWKRFEMEVSCLVSYMERYREKQIKPICFLDGSLIVSFVQHMLPDHQAKYINAIRQLLRVSTETRVPLIGFVDTTYANDLVVMLKHIDKLTIRRRVSDAALLNPLMKWGDRSQAYICARDDKVLERYYEIVIFVYLKTSSDHPPARLDFPRWIYEEGLHESVIDIVRAECLVGNGYPYPAETADAVAVLGMEDRERFYKLFQEFAQKNNMPLRFSKKAISKRMRRV